MKNLYRKLQQCRVELQSMNLKKSGHNKFAGYHYYELGDFLPHVNVLFLKHQIMGAVTFDNETAVLSIYDTETYGTELELTKEPLCFFSPMAEASLKGCHPIQNLGAAHTYQRRYLYQSALEIVESDSIEATSTKETQIAEKKPYPDEDFNKNLPAWAEKIDEGATTGEKIIAMISTKFKLSDDQIRVLQNA